MISAELYSAGIITYEAQENLKFEDIMHDVRAHLDLLDEVEEVKKFLKAMASEGGPARTASEGGPARTAAEKLAQQWRN